MILAEMTPARAWQRSSVSTETPAKINLTLDVLGRRADGYHDLRSLVIGVDLRDALTITAQGAQQPTISCNIAELENSANLAWRAAAALAGFLDRPMDVCLKITKRIPLAGGLGGGSSDAAAALRLCNQLWDAGLSNNALARIGASLGSDVPLFFHLPCALITGRGDVSTPESMVWSGWVLLLFPGIPVSTADVYRAWNPSDGGKSLTPSDAKLLTCRSAREMSALLSNQLESAVFRVAPMLEQLQEAAQNLCGAPVRVSGSGASMYVLFDDPQQAQSAAAGIQAQLPHVQTLVARAPVGEGPLFRVT